MNTKKFGVPCSLLGGVAKDADIPCCDEGEAMAMAAGAWLVGVDDAEVYSQNSGLGNMVDVVTSLFKPYNIPLPLLHVGFRTLPAHHSFMGSKTERLLVDILEYPLYRVRFYKKEGK